MKNITPFSLPDHVLKIASIFNSHGYELYAVGGAVRDLLIHYFSQSNEMQKYEDIDFTTDASPEEMMRMFPKHIPTGLQHGTITVLFKSHSYEITTYRVDNDYTDHRRPDSVQFTKSLKEDLARRDFTINAIAYEPITQTLIDLYEGIVDIQEGIIRCVGDPHLRFQEDALRMLRAIRFSSKLHFQIEAETLNAIHQHCKSISFVSKERICTEFRKTICSAYPDKGLLLLFETGLLHCIFDMPILTDSITSKIETRVALLHIAAQTQTKPLTLDDETIRLSLSLGLMLEHNKNITLYETAAYADTVSKSLKTLRFPNKHIQGIIFIVSRLHYIKCSNNIYFISISNYQLSYLISQYGLNPCTLLLQYLTIILTLISENNEKSAASALTTLRSLTELLHNAEFISQSIPKHFLAIKGNELSRLLNKPPGKWLGNLINTLHRHVLRHPQDNNTERLLSLSKTTYRVID